MELRSELCQSGTVHSDNTATLVHAGIQHVLFTDANAPLVLCLMLRIDANPSEKGPHQVVIDLVDSDARDVKHLGRISDLTPPPSGGRAWIPYPLALRPWAGDHELVVVIDNHVRESIPLRIAVRMPVEG